MIQEIGMHRVRCGDISDNLDELFQGEKASIFYCDPPWGNLNYWQTMNQKMTGADKKTTDLRAFLKRFADVAMNYTTDDAIIFVEYGIRWKEQVVAFLQDAGLVHLATGTMVYGSPERPLVCLVFDKNGMHHVGGAWEQRVNGTKGYYSLLAAIDPFYEPGEIICDPCCGLGYTAKYAVEHGMRFFGNELNAKRLERTIARLK